jgi:2'-5' RNA ligase
MIWEQAKTSAHCINHFYSPASWIPHITLAHGDVDPHKLTCAMESIAFQSFDWEIIVDNLALIGQDEDDTGREVLRVRFTG